MLLCAGPRAHHLEGGKKMYEDSSLEELLQLALKQALEDKKYFYVSCYLKSALESLQDRKETSKTSR
tara:strand:- start:72469 stop:72669 length:201 start_codon:yes stop_codon:yes gene_type:complete